MNWISSLFSSKPDQRSASTDPPDRAQRKACWDTRDAYFACLDQNNVLKPGQESGNICSKEKRNYEASCAKSWVSHLFVFLPYVDQLDPNTP